MSYKLLDCTLRDGGYYTNWDFDKSLVHSYINFVNNSSIEYIELGYRNLPDDNYHGSYYYLPESVLKSIRNLLHPSKKIVLMIDAKAFLEDENGKISQALENCNSYVYAVRIAANPKNIEKILPLAEKIKNLGYVVAVNIMYLNQYSDIKNAVNYISKYGDSIDWVYLVDSFGSCYPDEIVKAFTFVKSVLNQKIGFHSHDNISLAFANSLSALECGCDIVDSTVLGMGRGAGNLKTELMLNYENSKGKSDIDYISLGMIIEEFDKLKNQYKWGLSLPYMVSGFQQLPQSTVMDLVQKNRYSLASIIEKLDSRIIKKEETRLDLSNLSNLITTTKNFIIVGGGPSVNQHSDALYEFISKYDCAVIHSTPKNSYLNPENNEVYVCLPADESFKLKSTFKGQKYIINPEKSEYLVKNLSIKMNSIFQLTGDNEYKNHLDLDSPINMAILTILNISPKTNKIYLAGFDGDHLNPDINHETQNAFEYFKDKIKFTSITKTKYTSVLKSSVYGFLL